MFVSIAAGMDKTEVKNQQIQTEIVKTVEQHVQAGSTAKQQGVYTTHFIPLCHISKQIILIVDSVNKGIDYVCRDRNTDTTPLTCFNKF